MWRVYYQGKYGIYRTQFTYSNREIVQQLVSKFYAQGWDYVWSVKET